ncbi:hypothetical protein BJF93_04585 [Xaviernesmea oryzae]|uniref:Uncharacterized protein n=1 Tax=Xaviernesmea oryzae TaxID=464029 RepID=A0A1Q9AUP8_9HYPH|nr:DUF6074 family protein [Xaviernesmea oryzae]OLP59185.1 hypothetical protein BJF93_04585 [Xaviernesmea oryzae]SEK82678.1 hypothetical protein SAMN04487976_104124 [Xaviernesmea oryzae]
MMQQLGENGGQMAGSPVMAFPLASRRAVVRRCAAELDAVQGDEALAYWRSTCRSLAADLAALGCDESDIHMQILDFQTEVQLEMMRRYREDAVATLQERAPDRA